MNTNASAQPAESEPTTFLDAFQAVVLSPIQDEANVVERTSVEYGPQRAEAGTELFDVLTWRLLDNAQVALDTPARMLWYCYHYMPCHFDAISRLLLLDRQTEPRLIFADDSDDSDEYLVLDFGCGPMTAGIALNEFYKAQFGSPLRMNYVGFDTSRLAINIASEFAARDGLFPETCAFAFRSSWDEVSLAECVRSIKPTTRLLMIGSYLFGQDQLGSDDVNRLADFVRSVSEVATNAVFVYANAPQAERQAKYQVFLERLSLENHLPPVETYKYRAFRKLRRSNPMVRTGRFSYEVIKLK